MRILLVEDDRVLQQALAIGLRAEGHEVVVAADGRTAMAALREDDPDLVVLDLGLPDIPGQDVLAWLREWSTLPVVVLSARADSSDKVGALDAGADDYVTKPFGFEELLARIRAARRRAGGDTGPVTAGDLVIDLHRRVVTRLDESVHLTPKEWALLDVLVRADGGVVAPGDLLRAVWGPEYGTERNYLRTFLGTLRKKLEVDPARPRHLITEAGLGYRFETQPERDSSP
jgi:two-component system, OmpR family, KDP operon response regulator KdpE